MIGHEAYHRCAPVIGSIDLSVSVLVLGGEDLAEEAARHVVLCSQKTHDT